MNVKDRGEEGIGSHAKYPRLPWVMAAAKVAKSLTLRWEPAKPIEGKRKAGVVRIDLVVPSGDLDAIQYGHSPCVSFPKKDTDE